MHYTSIKKVNVTFLSVVLVLLLLIFAWAPWLDDQAIHDRVLFEKGWMDGTIQPFENIVASDEALQHLIEESRDKRIYNGILICDYNVKWVPFGRWVASCEGGYYVTFWGEIIP